MRENALPAGTVITYMSQILHMLHIHKPLLADNRTPGSFHLNECPNVTTIYVRADTRFFQHHIRLTNQIGTVGVTIQSQKSSGLE